MIISEGGKVFVEGTEVQLIADVLFIIDLLEEDGTKFLKDMIYEYYEGGDESVKDIINNRRKRQRKCRFNNKNRR